ncbi:MAG: CHAP domain-containing protein [Thermoleophilia bacterium]|nr:CHAP domain-containing protein [Thermoleophilia bacterium]
MTLAAVALGFLAAEIDHGVREEGGNNRGPRIRKYAANIDPPMPEGLAWCAMAVQYAADEAAAVLEVANPLDAVRQEALVQSYFDLLHGDQVAPADAWPGDLVLYKFNGSATWNHIGLVARVPGRGDTFTALEGNTSDENEREGDAVARKRRELGKYPVCFIAWPSRVTE